MADGAVLLRGFARPIESELMRRCARSSAQAPFRHMSTPGGHQMSVAMTNCGSAGWVTDRTGYRYDPVDPRTGEPWPAMPPVFRDLAGARRRRAASPASRPMPASSIATSPARGMSLHQDKDELDFGAPIVSVSLGLPAIFLFGGLQRSDKPRALPARPWRRRGLGRAVAARLSRRGAARRRRALRCSGRKRINLTFRRRARRGFASLAGPPRLCFRRAGSAISTDR